MLTNGKAERTAEQLARSGPLGSGRGSERGEAETGPAFAGVLISEVESESVSWLWRGWLALGKISVMDGDPGLGKSAAVLDLAARVSTGSPFPDGTACGGGAGWQEGRREVGVEVTGGGAVCRWRPRRPRPGPWAPWTVRGRGHGRIPFR